MGCFSAAVLSVLLSTSQTPGSGLSESFVGDSKLASIVARLDADRNRPIGELMGLVADQLLGTPYVGWTLERDVQREFCFVSLMELDCVTFFESTLGIARMLRAGGKSPSDLVKQVEWTRYRGGKVDGYTSRLHYTSDWMLDNSLRGNVLDLSEKLAGSTRFRKRFGYMTAHTSTYRQLVADPSLIDAIRKDEERLSGTKLYFIPLGVVARVEPELATGDIIGITTSEEGMDCSHTGIVRVVDGVRRFMHASSTKKKVVLDSRLSEYLMKHPRATGIRVVRPQ